MKRSEIEQLLPEVFQRTLHPRTPLFVLLEVMEALQTPSEEVLERLDAFFDPYRTPDAFVPYLAGWMDLDELLVIASEERASAAATFPEGMGRLRELIAAAAFLSRWRGTADGLRRFLQTATGTRGFAVEERAPGSDGQPRPFHLLIRAPAETERVRGLIERIVEMEKPAYVTYELMFYSRTENDKEG